MPTKNPIFYCSYWLSYLASLHVHKNIATIPTNTPFHSTLTILAFLLVHTAIATVLTKSSFLTQPMSKVVSKLRVSSQSLISYRLNSENWCIAGNCLFWRCLQSEWETINSTTLPHTLNLLSLLPYPFCPPIPFYRNTPLLPEFRASLN